MNNVLKDKLFYVWVAFAIGIVILIGNKPSTVDDAQLPKQFIVTPKDGGLSIGECWQFSKIPLSITLFNNTNDVINISSYSVSCGCTLINSDPVGEMKPDSKTSINVMFEVNGKLGLFEEKINVLNVDGNPEFEISLTGTALTKANFIDKTINMGLSGQEKFPIDLNCPVEFFTDVPASEIGTAEPWRNIISTSTNTNFGKVGLSNISVQIISAPVGDQTHYIPIYITENKNIVAETYIVVSQLDQSID